MTYDKATYTITFPCTVPETMPHRIVNCADPDVLTVEIEDVTENVLTLSVHGEHAISVFEEEMREQELSKYPGCEIETL